MHAVSPRCQLPTATHPHASAAQLPLGPSLPRFLLCFHAFNLPFMMLNAVRLEARRRAAKPDSPGALLAGRACAACMPASAPWSPSA